MHFLTVEAALFPELVAHGAGAPTHGVQYIGNKRKLLGWIREQIPEGVKTVVDAFAGGGSVSYMLKREGFSVHSNDSLHWPHHIARAILVNQTEQVTDEEIEALCLPNPKAGTFVRDHYKDKFWKPEIHGVIDEVRENIDALKGFKKDLALAALGATMLSARGWFPQFTTSKVSEDGYSPEQFHKRLGEVIRRLNSMVLDGPACTAQRLDVREFLPKVKADLAYFDPPYVTEFSAANYSANYHAVDAVMVKGEGRTPNADSVTRMEKTQGDLTKANIAAFFGEVFAAAEHIPDWILSYRDHSYPSEAELQEVFEKAGREFRLETKDFSYGSLAGKNRDQDPAKAKEYLFVGTAKKDEAAKPDKTSVPKEDDVKDKTPVDAAAIAAMQAAAADKSRMTARLDVGRLVAVAEAKPEGGEDHEIAFVLCHAGTNKNADHFTVEELKKAAPTAAGVKIDLKHGQKAQDIVGKTESAAFEEAEGGRVVCAGKLFTGSDELAAKARKLIHEELITKVSMECSYVKGECSICGHTHTTAADRCEHLKKQKGQKVEGKDCFEILREVTFTGAGLLEGNEPADPKADITSMASEPDGRMRASSFGGEVPGRAEAQSETVKQVLVQQEIREDMWRTQDAFHSVVNTLVAQFAAEAATLEETSTKIRQAASDTADRVIQILTTISKETGSMEQSKEQAASQKALKDMTPEELLKHAEELAAQNTDLAGKVQAAEDEKAKTEATKAAEALVVLMEKKGQTFADDAARQAEIERLAGLSDEARKAIADTLSQLPDKEAAPSEDASNTQAVMAAGTGALRANASATPPTEGDPEPKDLKTKLQVGFNAAYEERVSRERGEPTSGGAE
ncbi:MAG: DNA adenine methylase [bacterium]|nr:DNA adenine methylase [bacterium]